MQQLQRRLDVARYAAQNAAVLASRRFVERETLEVFSKGAQDRVTEVDRSTESLIRTIIERHFPGEAILGEEYGGAAPQQGEAGLWVIDPIDGTDCFVFGLPMWCISIAWITAGEAQVGVIYDPVHDETFSAVKNGGAFCNDRLIHASDASKVDQGVFGIGYSTRIAPEATLAPLEHLLRQGGMFHRCGSGALSLAWVAAGRLVGYYEPHINSWDCLAGLVLIREAGGWHSDFLAGDGLLNGNPLAACGPNLIEATRELAAVR